MKKRYGSKFKSQVALEAIRGDRTIAEIASEYNLHPNEDELLRKIGQLNVENDFLRKKYSDYLLQNGKS